jgi:hypothetical protein
MGKAANVGIIVGLGAAAALGLLLLSGKSSAASASPMPVTPPEPVPDGGGAGLQPDPNFPPDLPAEINYVAFQTANLSVTLENARKAATDKAACDMLMPVAQKLADTWVRIDQSGNAAKLVGECQAAYLAARQAAQDANVQIAMGCQLGGTTAQSIKVTVDRVIATQTRLGALVNAGCRTAPPEWPVDQQGQINYLSFNTADFYGKVQNWIQSTSAESLDAMVAAARQLDLAWRTFDKDGAEKGWKLEGDCGTAAKSAWAQGLQSTARILNGIEQRELTDVVALEEAKKALSAMTVFTQTYSNGCKAPLPNKETTPCDSDIAWARDIVAHVNGLRPLCSGGDQAVCKEVAMWDGQLVEKVSSIFKACGTVPADLTAWYKEA